VRYKEYLQIKYLFDEIIEFVSENVELVRRYELNLPVKSSSVWTSLSDMKVLDM